MQSSDHETPLTTDAERYRVVFAGVCALILSVGLARFAYTPMLPVMQQEAGMSPLIGGWLATFIYIGYTTGTLMAMLIKDPLRRYRLYRLCLILALASTLAMGFVTNAIVWMLLRFIGGLSGIAGMLLASGLVLNWLIRHRHRPRLGLHFTGAGLGIIVSGISVSLMGNWLSWEQQWIGLGLLGLLFFIPAWCWMPRPEVLPIGQTASHAPVAASSRRWLVLMAAAYFCAGCGYVVGATFIVDILEALPLLSGNGAWVWVIVGLAATPSTFLWDNVAHRIGQIPALLLAYGLQMLSMLLPAISDNLVVNLISAALWGGTFVGIVNLTLTLIGRRFPHNPSGAMAGLTLSYSVSQMVAPAMTGYVMMLTGQYQSALLTTTAVMAMGIALLLLTHWLEPEQQSVPAQA
ncbi:YbfB/YjiJ family MFS transporter [Oceanobacter sp. 5_MG-2023]|uniref:YbfB/YjiJ family MFS transporter n=1 Tax=Oceanobacter sp. 5_MG-2023 TaxID=3062645 RepID=UPI0026E16108|nr:YbfB/YjiJ family MFS transporter [Oceanobacter sp. 5_MG-2023]MDO6680682.1 YbfB/YjiJ family MFS transporter [Oceanobacter sp. 5_MG-2023]